MRDPVGEMLIKLPLSENMKQVVAEAEAEYGEPFAEIVRGFAADGESRRATAHILNTTEPTFARIRERLGIVVEWAKPTDTVGWKHKGINYKTTARAQAARKNLERARASNVAKYEQTRRTTPELMARAIAIHNQGKGWRQVAKELGNPVHHTTLRKQYNKHYRSGRP